MSIAEREIGVDVVALRVDALQELRKPFPAEAVGKLPKISCGACSKKNCTNHKPAKCQVCNAWISTAHVHLDYVGHATVTDRLLSVDPAWNWEPLVWTEEGFPRYSKGSSGEMELWIRLTVCGVTRIGVGSVAGNAFEAEKQLIGDAIRNAAMRFGVALDLWAKEDLESQLPEDESKPKAAGQKAIAPPANVDATTGEVAAPRKRKPPTQPHPADGGPLSGSKPAVEMATPEQVADIAELIDALKFQGEDWMALGRTAWKAAGVPSVGAKQLSTDDAAKAHVVLTKVLDEAVAAAMPDAPTLS